jgi:predicted dehydrogenase
MCIERDGNDMKEIKVGIVGFGFMGRAHTYGYKTMPLYYRDLPFKVTLQAVADPVPGVAALAAEELGFAYATQNPDELLGDPAIDVVDICTPNIYHKDGIIKALAAGKHVYCDKPLASCWSESVEVAGAARKSGRITQLALQYRFYTGTLRAKQLIEEGRLGRILSFRAAYLHPSGIDPNKPMGWKQQRAMGGGGVLLDLGSHAFDLMYFLMGEYDRVLTDNTIVYEERCDGSGGKVKCDAEDISVSLVRMKNGASGTIEASKVATGSNDEIRFEIHGTRGALRYNSMRPNELGFYDATRSDMPYGGESGFTAIECVNRYEKPGGGFPGPKFAIGFMRGHVHSLYNFVSHVYEGKQSSPSFEDGAYIQYVMEKAYESNSCRQWVTL